MARIEHCYARPPAALRSCASISCIYGVAAASQIARTVVSGRFCLGALPIQHAMLPVGSALEEPAISLRDYVDLVRKFLQSTALGSRELDRVHGDTRLASWMRSASDAVSETCWRLERMGG